MTRRNLPNLAHSRGEQIARQTAKINFELQRFAPAPHRFDLARAKDIVPHQIAPLVFITLLREARIANQIGFDKESRGAEILLFAMKIAPIDIAKRQRLFGARAGDIAEPALLFELAACL